MRHSTSKAYKASYALKYSAGFFLVLFMISGVAAQDAPPPGGSTYSAGAYVPGLTVQEPFQEQESDNEDLFTGQLNLNIPLHTLKSNAISLPISISYNTGGIRVVDNPGRIGYGWNLNAGGFIQREIKGRSDGYGGNTTASNIDATNHGRFWNNGNGSDPTSFGALTANKQGTVAKEAFEQSYDTEPDIYHFNFGGYSGKIVFDKDKIPHIISKQNIKVVVNFDPTSHDISSWTLITDNGVQYVFGTVETQNYQDYDLQQVAIENPFTIRLSNHQYITVSATYTINPAYHTWTETPHKWYLDKIVSPTGNNTINLTYETDGYIYYTTPAALSVQAYLATELSSSFPANPAIGVGLPIPNYIGATNYIGAADIENRPYQDITNRVAFKRLAKISSLFSVVVFNYGNNPYEFGGFYGYNALSSIDVKANDAATVATKSFAFNYHGEQGDDDCVSHVNNCSRRHLYYLTETANGQAKQPYIFYYNDDYSTVINNNIAYDRSDIQETDHWGYFNNNGTSTDNGFAPAIQYTNPLYASQGTLNFTGINKASSGNANGAGAMEQNILKSVTYPTGGSVSFVYEANTYYNTNTGTNDYVGGLRIKQLIKYDGTDHAKDMIRNYAYTLQEDRGKSSGSIDALPKYHYEKVYTNDAISTTGPYLHYHYLVGSPEPIVEVGTTNGSHIGYSCVTVSETGKGSTVYKFTSFNDHPDIANTNIIGTFSAPSTTGTYSVNLQPSPAVAQGPTTIYLPSTNMEMERGLLLSAAVYDNNGNIQKRTTYEYDFTDPQETHIQGLRSNMSGLFKGFSTAASIGTEIYTTILHSQGHDYDYYFSIYPPNTTNPIAGYFGFYSHISKRILLKKSTEEVYDQVNTSSKFPSYNAANVITNITTYSHSASPSYLVNKFSSEQYEEYYGFVSNNPSQTFHQYNNQLQNYTITTSDGRSIMTTYTYPRDYMNNRLLGSTALNAGVSVLQNTNQNDVVIETLVMELFPDGIYYVISGQLNDFNTNGLPQSTSVLEIQSPINISSFTFSNSPNNGSSVYAPDSHYKLRVTYDAYDAADNLTQTTNANDLPNAAVWGQNSSYIVAKAPNVKSNQIAFTSFEGPFMDYTSIVDGNLTFNTPVINGGRSGGYCTNQTVSTDYFASKLPSGTYKVGFWAKYDQVPANASYNLAVVTARYNSAISKNVDLTALASSNTWTYFETVVNVPDGQYIAVSPNYLDNGHLLLDDVSICPVGTIMSTYVYKPLVGLISETDPNHVSVFYEYDELNRLKLLRDQDQNIRSKTTYNYKQ